MCGKHRVTFDEEEEEVQKETCLGERFGEKRGGEREEDHLEVEKYGGLTGGSCGGGQGVEQSGDCVEACVGPDLLAGGWRRRGREEQSEEGELSVESELTVEKKQRSVS